jgi:hypothetical protein
VRWTVLGPIAQKKTYSSNALERWWGANLIHANSALHGTAEQQCQLWRVLDQPVGRGLMDLFHQRHRRRWELLLVQQLANYPP